MSGPLLDRASMLRAFALLAEGLAKRRVHADIYVVGGAAMALAWTDRRTTRDIDALFRTNRHQALLDEVWSVARAMNLPRSWLNEQATAYLPPFVDELDPTPPVVWDSASLRVMVAAPELVLAMKARACRPSDADDISALMTMLDLGSAASVVAVHDRFFVDDPLPTAKLAALRGIVDGDG